MPKYKSIKGLMISKLLEEIIDINDVYEECVILIGVMV
jgi:hypothetical protein